MAVVAVTPVAATTVACSSNATPAAEHPGTGGAPNHDAGGGGGGSGGGGSGGGGSGGAAAGDAKPPPHSCTVDDDCRPEMECKRGTCMARLVCPMGLEATFASIRTNVFAVSCGTDGSACHSHDGGNDSGGLILADDPYMALLGPDGKGAPAYNIDGATKNLRRVVPGDPDHSFLVIKLSTRMGQDPAYGSGMPFNDPGSVCPDTLSKIRAWITAGAQQ